jgi:HK97 family phage major capsid protein
MADLTELKSAADAASKTLADLRAVVEEKANSADVVDRDTLESARTEMATKFQAEQDARAALEAKISDLQVKMETPKGQFGGGKDDAKALGDFMRKGIGGQAMAGGEGVEIKAMASNDSPDGGFLVMPEMLSGIQARLRRTSPVRSVARVQQTNTNAVELLVERGDAGYEWVGETTARSDTATNTINRISIPVHELSALPKVSQRMLDDAGFDLGGWLSERVADRFARAEAAAFVSGTGIAQPKGFLSYDVATTVDASRANETLQYKFTGASGAFNSTDPADILVETWYELQPAYQQNATWMLKNTAMAEVATLKDASGFLLREILTDSGAITRLIQGRPAVVADDMPAIAADSLSIAVGDFSNYMIAENGGLTVLRDPYSSKPHVLFYTTKRVGGGVTDFDAIKLIKFGTS